MFAFRDCEGERSGPVLILVRLEKVAVSHFHVLDVRAVSYKKYGPLQEIGGNMYVPRSANWFPPFLLPFFILNIASSISSGISHVACFPISDQSFMKKVETG